MVDGLWNQARAKEREIQALRVDFGLLASILEDKRAALKTASQAQRQAAERPIAGESVEVVRLRWLRDLAELRLRHAEAVLGTLESEREFKAATLAYRVGEGDLLRRKAVTAQRMSPLSQEDRDAKLATLAAEQRALRGEAERAAAVEQKAQDALQAARNRLSEVRQRSVPEDAAPPAPELARLQQELDTSKAEADVASSMPMAIAPRPALSWLASASFPRHCCGAHGPPPVIPASPEPSPTIGPRSNSWP